MPTSLVHIKNTDIYLIDQILKDRYTANERILDAGCREGRNLHWFYHYGFELWDVDTNPEAIAQIKTNYPKAAAQFRIEEIADLSFESNYFDHIICTAVLHFAKGEVHFIQMFEQLLRVLKPAGTLFIRMTSTIGDPATMQHLQDGRYALADGSERFLLTPKHITSLQQKHSFQLLEPIKTTNVQDLRYMTTLVIQKQMSY